MWYKTEAANPAWEEAAGGRMGILGHGHQALGCYIATWELGGDVEGRGGAVLALESEVLSAKEP